MNQKSIAAEGPWAPPIWRRLFHLGACSAVALTGIFLSAGVMVALMAALSGIAVVVEAARFSLPRINHLLVGWLKPLLKASEDRRVTGATYIAISSLVAFLLFDKPIAITALFFLSLGDPVAALVGSRVGGVRVFGKSPWGTMAFVIVALGAAAVLSAAEVVDFHWALAAGAIVAALIELAPLMIDDNLTIPLISGAAMTLLLP